LSHTIVLQDAALTLDGATGVGFGSLVAGQLPEGNILLQGGVAYLSFAGSGADAGLVDTWAGDFGVGSTPAGDGTLTAGDVDMIDSTALAAATAEVSPRTRGTGNTQVILDNTAGTLEVNVSLLVDDADVSADTIPILVNGEIEILYTQVLDD
tara:strand:- start:12037 stop:12495 length:459 start_codon:yes stop_codon:yes gene_type:complete